MNLRDAYEFDREIYGGEGGLLGRLRAAMSPQEAYPVLTLDAVPEANPDSSGSPQGGLLGSLLALQAEQGRYGRPPPSIQHPNFRQRSPVPTTVSPKGMIGPSGGPQSHGDDMPTQQWIIPAPIFDPRR